MNLRILTISLALALAGTASTGVSARPAKEFADGPSGERQAPQRQGDANSIVDRIKDHGDSGVAGRILFEAGRAAVGLGSALGAGVGVLLAPSKIGCGPGEQCH